MDVKTGCITKNLLCMPIFGQSDPETGAFDLVGVATLINKIPGPDSLDSSFDEADIVKFRNFLVLVGMSISNSLLYESALRSQKESAKMAEQQKTMYEKALQESQRIKVLLEFAMSLYREDDLNNLNKKIILHARDLLSADRASVFVVDRERKEVCYCPKLILTALLVRV